MEQLDFRLEIKQIDEYGRFKGYAATYDLDLGNDIIERGAFEETRQENPKVPLLWQHDPSQPIGVTYLGPEDDYGLPVEGEINLEVTRGREAYALLKQGAMKGLSIGYEAEEETWEGGIRRLKKIRLWEVSLVTFPMNPKAGVVAVKAVVPFQDLPLASEDRSWDADAARARVARWASSDGSGDKDKVDWSKYRKAFVWYDAENAENFGAYKLPIADVIDGRLIAVPRAIYAAAAAVQGARGGVNIPDSDIPGVKRHLERYYKKMGKEPPWAAKRSDMDFLLYAVIGAASEVKAGRVLSAANRALVEEAIRALQALLAAADASAGQDESDEDKASALLDEAIRDVKLLLEVA